MFLDHEGQGRLARDVNFGTLLRLWRARKFSLGFVGLKGVPRLRLLWSWGFGHIEISGQA